MPSLSKIWLIRLRPPVSFSPSLPAKFCSASSPLPIRPPRPPGPPSRPPSAPPLGSGRVPPPTMLPRMLPAMAPTGPPMSPPTMPKMPPPPPPILAKVSTMPPRPPLASAPPRALAPCATVFDTTLTAELIILPIPPRNRIIAKASFGWWAGSCPPWFSPVEPSSSPLGFVLSNRIGAAVDENGSSPGPWFPFLRLPHSVRAPRT